MVFNMYFTHIVFKVSFYIAHTSYLRSHIVFKVSFHIAHTSYLRSHIVFKVSFHIAHTSHLRSLFSYRAHIVFNLSQKWFVYWVSFFFFCTRSLSVCIGSFLISICSLFISPTHRIESEHTVICPQGLNAEQLLDALHRTATHCNTLRTQWFVHRVSSSVYQFTFRRYRVSCYVYWLIPAERTDRQTKNRDEKESEKRVNRHKKRLDTRGK